VVSFDHQRPLHGYKLLVLKGGAMRDNEAENDRVLHRLLDLNREMMRLPMEERRQRWNEYYTRLGELMKPSREAAE
jgi:hypothetical protein